MSADHAGSGPGAPRYTFGEAMERLEAIVSQLEGNETLGLEEALALHEQGLALAADCRQRLAAAQLRLTEIPVPAVAEDEPPMGAEPDKPL